MYRQGKGQCNCRTIWFGNGDILIDHIKHVHIDESSHYYIVQDLMYFRGFFWEGDPKTKGKKGKSKKKWQYFKYLINLLCEFEYNKWYKTMRIWLTTVPPLPENALWCKADTLNTPRNELYLLMRYSVLPIWKVIKLKHYILIPHTWYYAYLL